MERAVTSYRQQTNKNIRRKQWKHGSLCIKISIMYRNWKDWHTSNVRCVILVDFEAGRNETATLNQPTLHCSRKYVTEGMWRKEIEKKIINYVQKHRSSKTVGEVIS